MRPAIIAKFKKFFANTPAVQRIMAERIYKVKGQRRSWIDYECPECGVDISIGNHENCLWAKK